MQLIKNLLNKLFGPSDDIVVNLPTDHILTDGAVKPDIDNDAEFHKDSTEPWVAVVGEGIEDGRLKLQLDWNEAFIIFLQENGFTGSSDEETVARWMSMVDRELNEQFKGK